MSQYGVVDGTNMGTVKVATDWVEDGTAMGAIDGALGDTAGATYGKMLGAIDGFWTNNELHLEGYKI
jgi:hypothetical protein